MPERHNTNRRAALIGAALLCAAAAGCTAGPPAPEDGGPARPVVAPAEPAASPDEPRTAATPPPAAPVIDADPKRLDGLDAAGLAALLGAPAFSRTDGPATLLRWRNEGCVLDAFLYAPRGKTDTPRRVNHVEARAVKGGTMAVRDCFAALLRARASQDKG